MPRFLIGAFVLAMLFCASASGQQFGVGIIAGNPTGLSVKKWLESGNAIDGAAAWSFEGDGAVQLHADYLWHHHFASLPERMPLYYGLGGRLSFEEDGRRHDGDTRAGVRVPVGITYLFESAPVDIFFEVVPTLDVAPRTDLELDAAIGVRFYFW
jgi:hypothetical protein